MSTAPRVRLSTLFDGHNYKDDVFKDFVEKWTNRCLPGGPMGLLDTDSESAYERWYVEADTVHVVRKVSWSKIQCPECGWDYEEDDRDEDGNIECCDDDDGQPIPVEVMTDEGWAVVNENIDEFICDTTGYARRDVEPWRDEEAEIDAVPYVYIWEDKAEAEEAAAWCDQAYHNEHGHENSYGFPWAHNWWHMPESFIPDKMLKDAGFTVAHYTGGNGRDGQNYRLCGIDGGGYNFARHFVRLVVAMFEENDWTLPTAQGSAHVTADERDDLEVLGDALNEEGVHVGT